MRLPKEWEHLQITNKIGSGSFGTVFEAENTLDDSVCAIKVISFPADELDKTYAKRTYGERVSDYFRTMAEAYTKEVTLLSEVSGHKNIISIFDYKLEAQEDGIGWNLYIQMELLEELVAFDFDEEKVIQLGVDICSALEECEKKGIVHRDIKPGNILMDESGMAKLCDFGNAGYMEKTMQNSVKGTVGYMAPELYKGDPYNKQVDIYSLGLVMHMLLNKGRRPFMDMEKDVVYFADEEASVERRMKGETIPDPVEASPAMAEIIGKACAYSIDKRYRSATEMKNDLWGLKLGTYKLKNKRKKKKAISYDRKQTIWKAGIFGAAAVLVCLFVLTVGQTWVKSMLYTRIDVSSKINRNGVLMTDGSETIEQIAGMDPSLKNRVKKIVITEEIDEIQDEMFADCPALTEVMLPASVDTIGERAFADCSTLETISLPKGLENIGQAAFQNCQALMQLSIPEGMDSLPAELCKGCTALQEVAGGDDVTRIGSSAFYGCTSLEKMDLLRNAEKLGSSCFYDCRALRNISLAENLQTIPEYTFFQCTSLEQVALPAKLSWIAEDAFGYCESLESVEIPHSVKGIGALAFENCSHLQEVSVSEDTMMDEASVFLNCKDVRVIRK